MRRLFPIIEFALPAALLAACWGEVKPIYPDGGAADGDADTDTDTGAIEAIAGGGTAGGPIDGALDVFLFDEATGDPVAGARVLVEPAGDDSAPLEAKTDAGGHARVEDADLVGPVALHAAAAGYVIESVLGLDAALCTFPLCPTADLPEENPATLAGVVEGTEAVADPGGTSRRVMRLGFGPVLHDALDYREPLYRGPTWSGPIDLDESGGAFSLQVAPGVGAVYALAGTVETFGTDDESDDEYSWSHLGATPAIDAGAGATVQVELELTTTLFFDNHVTFGAFPGTYETPGVEVVLDLGAGGAVWLATERSGSHWITDVPTLEGDFSKAEPMLIARGDQEVLPEEAADELEAAPYGRVFRRDLDPLHEYDDVEPYVFQTMLPSAGQVGFDGERITCLPPAGNTLGAYALVDGETGAERWRATILGELPASQPLPPLPESWGVSVDTSLPAIVRASMARLDADPQDLELAAYPELVTETSFEAVWVE